MIEVGSKVYCWQDSKDEIMDSLMSQDPIIGNIISIDGDQIEIKSIIDCDVYMVDKKVVYEIGTGPVLEKRENMLAYCDKIAHVCQRALIGDMYDEIIDTVSPVKMDLHPTEGYFVSTKKTFSVTDMNGKKYKVTIEEDK